jgi:hypothetical protein
MQTKPTIEPTRSPVPGVIPEPVRVHGDTVAARQRHTATGTTTPGASPGRRNPARIVSAKLLSIIRGDQYRANAYPPARRSAAAARGGS